MNETWIMCWDSVTPMINEAYAWGILVGSLIGLALSYMYYNHWFHTKDNKAKRRNET